MTYSRYRSKTGADKPLVGRIHMYSPSGDGWVTRPPDVYNFRYNEFDEVMYDEVAPGPRRGRLPQQAVYHSWTRVLPPEGGRVSSYSTPDTPYMTMDPVLSVYGREGFPPPCRGPLPYTSAFPELLSEVRREVAGLAPVDQNLFLDILEIGDVMSLISTAKQLTSDLIARNITIKSLSNGYLGTIFGAMPLINTVRTLMNWQSRVQKRANELALSSGKFRKVTRKRQQILNDDGTMFSTIRDKTYTSITETITCAAMGNYDISVGEVFSLAAQMFGFTSPFATLYQHGRLTFLLDWLVAVGNHVEAQERKLFGLDGVNSPSVVCIRDACYSTKIESGTCVTYDGLYYGSDNFGYGLKYLTEFESYQRDPGLPTGEYPSSWLGSGWTLGKAITAAALVFQKVG